MSEPTPVNALDPRVMLATTVHAQPGKYAVLLGSGVSTGAGIPTGWGVVRELVRRAAAATSPTDDDAPQLAYQDPESWWSAHGDGQPLGYSSLLASLAPTPAARRALLAGFFEPTDDEVDAGLKVPSAAHRAIAQLVRRGSVKVIVTTNFDRLTERALEDAGISPQVISSIGALAGMSPLQHAPATVIKLHGDYADLLQRNTVDELSSYPAEWNDLLDRILSEYGLIVSGWSADWDHALVGALERQPIRRYPLFWDSRSAKGENAQRILAAQRGTVLQATDADALFTDLLVTLEALDRLAEPPLTTALSIERLKRYLPDERRRLDLHDLVATQTSQVVAAVEALPQQVGGQIYAELEELMRNCERATAPLAQLVTVGIQHDIDARFTRLWVDCLQQLINAPRPVDGGYQEIVTKLRHYPALLLLRAAGLACLHFGRDDLLFALLTRPTYRPQFYNDVELIAAHALADYRVLDTDMVRSLPRTGETRWHYPQSHLLREAVLPITSEHLPTGTAYRELQDDLEFVVALAQHLTSAAFGMMPGEFVGERGWSHEGFPLAEGRFRRRADQAPDDWPWFQLAGGRQELDDVLIQLRERFKEMQRW